MRRWSLAALPCLSALGFTAAADEPAAPAKPAAVASKAEVGSFSTQARPFLDKYCVSCHGSSKPKADLNLTAFSDEASVVRARKLWVRLKDYVESGEMPPEDQDQPTEEEADRFNNWIEAT